MPFYPIPSVSVKAIAAPTGTTNTSGLMMGLAGAITPNSTGRVMVLVSGNIISGTTNDGAKVEL